MRITNYKAVLGECNRTLMFKESSVYYPACERFERPVEIADMMREVYHLDTAAVEYLYLLALNNKGKVIGVYMVSKGNVGETLCCHREIMIAALQLTASFIVLVHNHPTGDLQPSKDDIQNTEKIKQIADLVGIPLHDHIIIAGPLYYSMKGANIL